MSILNKIAAIKSAAHIIKDVMVRWGVASSSDKLANCANKLNGVTHYQNDGGSITLGSGKYQQYVSPGYYDGTSLVKIDKVYTGGGDIALSPSKNSQNISVGYYGTAKRIYVDATTATATPSKTAQTITGGGLYLTSVTVEAIPADYMDGSEIEAQLAAI